MEKDRQTEPAWEQSRRWRKVQGVRQLPGHTEAPAWAPPACLAPVTQNVNQSLLSGITAQPAGATPGKGSGGVAQ